MRRPAAPAGDDPAAAARAEKTASFLRRQLVLAVVAGAVVLAALVAVAVFMDRGRDAAHAALRPATDGSGVTAVSPLGESFRSATWAVVVALVAVAAILTVLVDHVVRVARFTALARPGGRSPRDDAAAAAAQEDC